MPSERYILVAPDAHRSFPLAEAERVLILIYLRTDRERLFAVNAINSKSPDIEREYFIDAGLLG